MSALFYLTRRNSKLFFKDKGMFFTSLITPLILLVLYTTFLAKVYRDSFAMNIPEAFSVSDKLLNGFVASQLFSSLLAVSCITVAFCSNMLIVQDKVSGARNDITISPAKSSAISLSYYISTAITTLIVSFVAMVACFVYIASCGWFLSVTDVLLVMLDIFMLVMFGTALSSVINFFLSSQGQISAVGTIVSAGYGFVCGAYMPISNFGSGLQKVISFFPGTYGTSLLRNHAMHGAFLEMEKQNFPAEMVEKIKDSIDCNFYFFGTKVSIGAMYAVLFGTVALLIGIYILLNALKNKSK